MLLKFDALLQAGFVMCCQPRAVLPEVWLAMHCQELDATARAMKCRDNSVHHHHTPEFHELGLFCSH